MGILNQEACGLVVPRVVVGCALSRGQVETGREDVVALVVLVMAVEVQLLKVETQVCTGADLLAHPSVSSIFNIITFQVVTPYIVLGVLVCGCDNSN